MAISPIDPRLSAADLALEEFVGSIVVCGDVFPGDEFLDTFPRKCWESLPEHALLRPVDGYSLRATVPSTSHAAFLIHDQILVGIFMETDTLVLHGDHQGKGLGQELVLLAFAQKPWRSIQGRKVSDAGRKTLCRAHQLALASRQDAQTSGRGAA
jgi:hypothetical protein